MFAKLSPNARGALLALLAFGTFATHDVIVKILGGYYSPFQIVFFNVLLAFPLLSVMLIGKSTPGTLRPRHLYWGILRTLCVVITGASAFYAFSVLPLAETYAILFSSPLLITLLAIPVLGEKVGLRRGLAVLVGLAGVAIVLRPGTTVLTVGHFAALTAAFGGAFASVIVRRIGREERSAVLILFPMLANFAVMGAFLPTSYEPMPVEHLGMLGLTAVLGFLANILLIAAYRSGEAAIVAPMQYSQLIWAVVYGALFFSEKPDLWTLVGASVIIGSGLYIVLRESGSDASANQPVLRTRSRAETGTVPRVAQMAKARFGGKLPAPEDLQPPQ